MQIKSAPRRRHAAELKARVLAACNEPGASVAAVALAHGLNAKLVHKWRRGVAPVDRPPASCKVFGSAQAHHGYLFANARATRIKLLVHDGFGVWCAARRLNDGRFVWPRQAPGDGALTTLTQPQFDALVLGLPWRRLEQMRVITCM